jgi:hypothetical protein
MSKAKAVLNRLFWICWILWAALCFAGYASTSPAHPEKDSVWLYMIGSPIVAKLAIGWAFRAGSPPSKS